jgi:CAAX amino terminal protease family.
MSVSLGEDKGNQPGLYQGYLEISSMPLTCFFFTLPLFIVYHGGLWWLNNFSDLRWANAADIAIADALGKLGMAGPLLSFIFVVMVFLLMQSFSKKTWQRPSFTTWFVMILESFVFALPVFMLSRLVVSFLDTVSFSALYGEDAISWQANLILSCGAGVYEEFLFRLILMGIIIIFLDKILRIKSGWKYIIAAVLQALVFAASHHLPSGPEAILSIEDFQMYLPAFSFRTVAGIYFAFLYIERGFGIAAGSHALYDLLVVALDMWMTAGTEV